MPLQLDDALPIAIAAVPALRDLAKSLRRKSDGGRKITKAERDVIVKDLRDLADRFAREALD